MITKVSSPPFPGHHCPCAVLGREQASPGLGNPGYMFLYVCMVRVWPSGAHCVCPAGRQGLFIRFLLSIVQAWYVVIRGHCQAVLSPLNPAKPPSLLWLHFSLPVPSPAGHISGARWSLRLLPWSFIIYSPAVSTYNVSIHIQSCIQTGADLISRNEAASVCAQIIIALWEM